jgi:O-antigen ligase
MAEYTPTGSVIDRIQRTKFYGITPDSRRGPFREAWERSFEHPWIGHGPYYDIGFPVAIYYTPHNSYLHYFYTIGIIGLVIFVWFMVVLLRMTLRYMSARTGIATFSTDLLVVMHVQIVIFLIDAYKIDYQRSSIYFLMLWLVFGMAAACYRVAERRTAEIREAALLAREQSGARRRGQLSNSNQPSPRTPGF